MPIYEYQCKNLECKYVIEEFVNASEGREDVCTELECEQCGNKGFKIIMSVGFFQMDPIA